MLFRKMLREIRSNFGQFFAIFAMVALAGMVYMIVSAYSGGMKHFADSFYSNNNLPDLWAYGEIDDEILDKIKDIDGVANANRILTVRGSTLMEDEEIPVDMVFLDSGEVTINRFHVYDGIDYDANEDGLWIGRMFAESQGIKVGDDFTVTYEDYEITKKVLGIIGVPDRVYVVADDSTIFQDSSKFGWVYMPMTSFPEECILDQAIKSDEVKEFLGNASDIQKSVNQLIEMGFPEDDAWDKIKESLELESNKTDLKKAVSLAPKIKDKSATISEKEGFIKSLDEDFEVSDGYVYSTCIIDIEGTAPGILEKGDEGFDKKLAYAKAKISDIDGVEVVAGRDSCYSFVSYKSECEEGDTYSVMFTFIFVFIAVLSLITTMHRFVKQQRVQIGTIKALGFRKRKVIFHYLGYGFFVSLIGIILGDLIGYYGLANLLVDMESTIYDVPNLTRYFDPANIVVGAVILSCILLVTYFSCAKILRESAAQALRLEVPKIRMKQNDGSKGITAKLNFASKWNLRDIKRSKARTVTGVVGIMGATLIVVLAFGMMDSFDRYIIWNFDDILHYKYSLSLSEDIKDSELDDLYDKYGDASSQTVMMTYKNSKGELVDGIITVNDSKGMLRVSSHDIKTYDIEEGIPGSTVGDVDEAGSIIVTEKLLKKIGVELGDKVTWQPAGSDKWYESTIVATGRHPQMQQFTMTRSAYEGLDLEYKPETIYTNSDLDGYEAVDIEGVSSMASVAALKTQLRKMLSTFTTMIWLFGVLASILGLVIIYNMGVLSMSEKNYQFATLKVLGFRNRRVRAIYKLQNIWIAIAGIILGLPAGFYFTDYIFKHAIGDSYDFFATVDISTYLIASGFMLVVTAITNIALGAKINKIDMVTALKANE